MKKSKSIFSVFLALLMMLSIIPMSNIILSAATTPPTVSESEARDKIYELYEILGEDSLFTTTRTETCGVKSSGHGCDYCKLSEIIEQQWFIDEFGTTTIQQYPHTYNSSGKAGGPDGSSCFGFAAFAEWYVFSSCETDKVTTQYVGTFASNYENATAYVRTGDLIRFGSRHSAIVISCDSTGIQVLDSNWGIDGYNCQVKMHNVKYNFTDTFTISRATNSSAVSSTPVAPPTCDCSTSYEGNYRCTTTGATLNIRSGHGTTYSVIGSIPEAAIVSVSKANGEWAHITYGGVVGYASMSYLEKIEPIDIKTSADSVNLKLGETESQVIDVWTEGNFGDSFTVQCNSENDKITCTLGALNSDNKMPLTITAKATGTSKVNLSVKDNKSGTILSAATISVNVDAKTYIISFDANGGNGAPSSQTKTHGTVLTLPTEKPTRTGYTFLGWSVNRTATTATYSAGGNLTANADMTLYAVWQKNDLTVSSIEIASNPVKTEYYVGDTFDSTGLSLKVNMSDGTTKTVTSGFAVTNPDMTTAGTKTVVVEYSGKTVTFTVNVIENPVTPDPSYTFYIVAPTTNIVSYKNTVVLKTKIEGDAPENSRIEWTSSNDNFSVEKNADGTLKITSQNNGNTVFTATLCDAEGNVLATDEIEMSSKAGFLDKLIRFFLTLFGLV